VKESIVFELTEKFEYASKGDMVQASFIELAPPTSKNMTECAALKQAFYRALPEGDDDNSNENPGADEKIAITGSEVIALILRSKDVELITVLLHAHELFKSVGLVEGEEKLTKPLIDKISPDDFENMVGEYLINFILASTLQKMKKN